MPTAGHRQGHAATRKVRFVCKPCNNRWLSQIETATKPILIPLITGTPHSVSPSHQELLATWVAKTVMAAEFVHPQHIAIPQNQRTFLMNHRGPPERWFVAIGDYHGTTWRNVSIFHQIVRLNPAPVDPTELSGGRDTQVTSIGIGRLFIQAASTTYGSLEFGFEDETISDMRPIWPARGLVLGWPPFGFLDDRKAYDIASSLSHIIGIPPSL
jgi:hypothetical protein